MASTVYFLLFMGLIITIIKSVTSESSYEWNVERSSVNPFSYTDETDYSRLRTTERPVLPFSPRSGRCPVKEHYTLSDTRCQKTCDNYKKPFPCLKAHIRGCVCDKGFVRGPDKKCIKPENCPAKPNAETQRNWCEEYEVWDFRYAHCPRNCSNYDDVLRCRKIFVAGCVCDYANGYVRGTKGKCITIEECPNIPDKYSSEENLNKPEIYSKSYVTLNPPPYTDDDYHIPDSVTKNPPNLETENHGFEETGIPTISQTELPIRCQDPLQYWVDCAAHCQRTCSNKDDKDFDCKPVCVPGCICKKNLVKGPNDRCIEKDKCPAKSVSERNFYVTLNPPPYTDDDYHIPDSVRKNPANLETENPQFMETEIPPISQTKLPIRCLDPLQYWVPCAAHCQRTCSNKDDKGFDCKPVCVPGCICKGDLVKGPKDRCIEKDKCPAKSDSERNFSVTLNPPPYTDDDYHIPDSVTKNPANSETENPQFEETEIPPISQTNQFPFIICRKYEVLNLNLNSCPDDCNNYKETNRQCEKAKKSVCVCKKGLVRDPEGKCIKPSECQVNHAASAETPSPMEYTDDDFQA